MGMRCKTALARLNLVFKGNRHMHGVGGVRVLAMMLTLVIVASAVQAAETQPSSYAFISPPEGYCSFDASAAENAIYQTDFKQGLEGSSTLAALFVPCAAAAMSGRQPVSAEAAWLPEWMSIETNPIPFTEDMDAAPGGLTASMCGSGGGRHLVLAGDGFSDMVATSHSLVSITRPVIYFGVVGEDLGACYIATLTLSQGPTGEYRRFLTVTSIFVADKQWIYVSRRAHAPYTEPADALLQSVRSSTKAFLAKRDAK
jgi:hypothetical protein